MTFQFKIQIKDITKPPVWRRITVPSSYTFFQLHVIIQIAFGWENAHLYKFSPKDYRSYPIIKESFDGDYEDNLEPNEVLLSQIFETEKQKFTYIYDFGDNWTHIITLEKILSSTTMFPQLITGKGQCPPEDCGGVWGYEDIKAISENPEDQECESYREWLGLDDGEKWDAHFFDLEEKQNIMLEVFSKRK